MARKTSKNRNVGRGNWAPESRNYRTPRKLRLAVVNLWGWPSVDVCADENNVFAAEGKHINKFMDGLTFDWYEDTAYGHNRYYAWCYPPANELEVWLDKAREQQAKGCASLVLFQFRAITMAIEESLQCSELFFLRPRIRPIVQPGDIPKTNYRQFCLFNFLPEYRATNISRLSVLHFKHYARETRARDDDQDDDADSSSEFLTAEDYDDDHL